MAVKTNDSFSEWVFKSLVEKEIINSPTVNLSVVNLLRQSTDQNDVLWGLIGASLVNKGQVGKKLSTQYEEYAKQYCQSHSEFTDGPDKFCDIMKRAAVCASIEWKKRYRES